jgi:hypothetical protein
MSNFLPANNEMHNFNNCANSFEKESHYFFNPGSYYFNKETIVYLPENISFKVNFGYNFEYPFHVNVNDLCNINVYYCPGSYYFNKETIVYLPDGIPFTINSGYSFLFKYGFYVTANDIYYINNVNYYQLNSENVLEEVLNELSSEEVSHEEVSHEEVSHEEVSHEKVSHEAVSHVEVSPVEVSHVEISPVEASTDEIFTVNKQNFEKIKESIKFLMEFKDYEYNVGRILWNKNGEEMQKTVHKDIMHIALLSAKEDNITFLEAEKYYGKGVLTPADILGLSEILVPRYCAKDSKWFQYSINNNKKLKKYNNKKK